MGGDRLWVSVRIGRAGEEFEEFEEFNGHVLSFLWKLEKDTIAKDEVHSLAMSDSFLLGQALRLFRQVHNEHGEGKGQFDFFDT